MSDPNPPGPDVPQFGQEEMQSALFAQLVTQLSGMATMLLGKSPHPETGKTMRDLDAAQMFIGQLEMLETKTRGNLNKMEEALLKQALMALHMAFVEAVEKPPQQQTETKPAEPAVEDKPQTAEDKPATSEPEATEESKKRFSKKFSL